MGRIDLLARAGLPTPEGMVLTREAHREFLSRGGLMKDILASRSEGARRRVSALRKAHLARPLDGGLGRLVRGATLGLEARTVAVVSRRSSCGGLGTVPAVLSAVRGAWLHAAGLRRQVSAAMAGEEIPLWPVLIQREPYPEYTGWSTTGDFPAGALYDIEPSGAARPGGESMAHLTSRAGDVLGETVRLRWGLEGGRWYLLSIETYDPGRREGGDDHD